MEARRHPVNDAAIATRLSPAALAARSPLAADRTVHWPPRDEQPPDIGVIHFGPGAFHRAHQAYYFDHALDQDRRWGVCAVATRSASGVDALARQGGLYTLATLDHHSSLRVIRSIRETLYTGRERDLAQFLQRCADPRVALVTLTITEKGYCLAPDGTLDFSHRDIVADLARPQRPASALGWLVAGLAHRHAAGGAPLTVLSCDNRRHNGRLLRHAIEALSARSDPALADWIAARVAFPDSMVDAITPAATDALRTRIAAHLGLRDDCAVQREAFCQWVIANDFRAARPDFAGLGVTLVDDVASWERAKLRILNGAHSTLAYIGLLRGHGTVRDAMRDPELRRHLLRMLRDEVQPGLQPGLDDYLAQTLARFENPMLEHRLAQIACDGSQKLPYRIVEPIQENLAAGRPITALAATLAAWLLHLREQLRDPAGLNDPLAPRLLALAGRCNGEPAHDIAELLTLREVIPPDCAAEPALRRALAQAYAALSLERLPAAAGHEAT